MNLKLSFLDPQGYNGYYKEEIFPGVIVIVSNEVFSKHIMFRYERGKFIRIINNRHQDWIVDAFEDLNEFWEPRDEY